MAQSEWKALTEKQVKDLALSPLQGINLYKSKINKSFAFKFFCTGNEGQQNGWLRFDKQLIDTLLQYPNSYIVLLVNMPNPNLRKVMLIENKASNKNSFLNQLNIIYSKNIIENQSSISIRKLKDKYLLLYPKKLQKILKSEHFIIDNKPKLTNLEDAFKTIRLKLLKEKSNNQSIANAKDAKKQKEIEFKKWGKVDILKRLKVEQCAVDFTKNYFASLNYKHESFEKEKVGWDITFTNETEELFVEVKGLSGNNISVEFTPNEYSTSIEKQTNGYRIAIVTNALAKIPELHLFEYDTETGIWKSNTGKELEIKEKTGAVLKAY